MRQRRASLTCTAEGVSDKEDAISDTNVGTSDTEDVVLETPHDESDTWGGLSDAEIGICETDVRFHK